MHEGPELGRRALLGGALAGLALAACSSSSGHPSGAGKSAPPSSGPTPAGPASAAPPVNPYLAASVVPVGHGNSAQTNGLALAGPTGPTRTLSGADIQYQFAGPGHFGLCISPPYPDGSRVIWSNGGDRIVKLDYQTMKVLATLPLPGKTLMTEAESESAIAAIQSKSGAALATEALQLAAKYLVGITGVYFALDRDNTLFVSGKDSIIAYHDADPADPHSPIAVRDEWKRPSDVSGGFVGANMTFDGKLVVVTDEGQIVVLARDFSSYVAIAIPGSEVAAAHNAEVLKKGLTAGAGSWVRNSIAVDPDGGIYVASLDQQHRVVWNGKSLSTDAKDGAWSAPYLNGTGLGTGATPALMGFGSEDPFVVITDGEPVMNVVIFWRNEIPSDWKQLPGAPSRRIAGMARADMGNPKATSVQTQQGVVVGGYGAFVVNNAPHSVPANFPSAATQLLAAYAGADPMFTPKAMQKFEWDPKARHFALAWTNTKLSSPNAVPIVSTGSNIVYTVGVRDRKWTVEGVDWTSGKSAFHWVTGSNRYNSNFSGISLDQEGRICHATEFGLVRYTITP